MAKTKKTDAPAAVPSPTAAKSEPRKKRAVLFELENIAVGGRQIAFDVMKKIMADKGVKLTPFLFSRYCLDRSLKNGVGELLESLGKVRLSKEKLVADIIDDMKSALLRESLALAPVMKKLTKRAAEENVVVGALSCLDRDTARQLVDKLKLSDEIAEVVPCACGERNYPSADAWLKLAKNMSISPGACVVVATCSRSSQSAVSSGMRCLVVPDSFTSFQDFGGADYVLDTLDDAAIDRIFELLEDR